MHDGADRSLERQHKKGKGITMFRVFCLATSLLFVCGCLEPEADPDLTAKQSEIVNGTVDNGHYQVVQVSSSSGNCTGTMLGRRTTLTAAHCAPNGSTVTVIGLSRIFDVDCKCYYYDEFSVSGTIYHNPSGLDIAVIVLQYAHPGTIPYGQLASYTPVGGLVTLVGYGYTSASSYDYGTKRYGYNTIDSASSGYFTHSGASSGDSTVCFGDSGGPAFSGDYSSRCVVGVAYATYSPYCTDAGGIHTRVDNTAAWIRSVSPDTIGGC